MDQRHHHPDDAELIADLCEPVLETKQAFGEKKSVYENFRQTNDERLAAIARGRPDVLLEEKTDRLNAEIDRIEIRGTAAPENKAMGGRHRPFADDPTKNAVIAIGKEVLRQGQVIDRVAKGASVRPKEASRLGALEARLRVAEIKSNRPQGMGSSSYGKGGLSSQRAGARAQFKAGVISWMRTGQEIYKGEHLSDLARKAWHSGLNPSGGYLLTPDRASPLDAMLVEMSPMRQLAEIKVLTGDELEMPVNKKGTTAGWVGEREDRPETGTPDLALMKFPLMELYAEPSATQRILDNSDLDIESWLYGEVVEAFALQESDAFINGDGLKQPKGLLTYDLELTHGNWAHGKFRGIATGANGAFPAETAAPDKLIDVTYSLKGAYRPSARWLFSRTTAGVIRKMKDGDDRYVWREGIQAGQPPELLGYEISEDEHFPEIGANTISVGFGDWKRTYLIIEKTGVRILRDPYSSKPYVKFYTTKMVGGAVKMFDAAVFLKFSA